MRAVVAPRNFRDLRADGTRVSAETLQRVACDCGLVAVGSPRPTKWGEVDARSAAGEGLPGRRSRSIPPAIRHALLLRDHGCAFPGCTHNRFLHGHHIQHWLQRGETSPAVCADIQHFRVRNIDMPNIIEVFIGLMSHEG